MFDFTPDIDCVYFIISGLSSKSGRLVSSRFLNPKQNFNSGHSLKYGRYKSQPKPIVSMASRSCSLSCSGRFLDTSIIPIIPPMA